MYIFIDGFDERRYMSLVWFGYISVAKAKKKKSVIFGYNS